MATRRHRTDVASCKSWHFWVGEGRENEEGRGGQIMQDLPNLASDFIYRATQSHMRESTFFSSISASLVKYHPPQEKRASHFLNFADARAITFLSIHSHA